MKRKRFSQFEYSNSQPQYSTSVHFPSGFQFHASASSDRWVNNLTSNSQCTLLFQSRWTRQHSRGPRPTLDNNCLHVQPLDAHNLPRRVQAASFTESMKSARSLFTIVLKMPPLCLSLLTSPSAASPAVLAPSLSSCLHWR